MTLIPALTQGLAPLVGEARKEIAMSQRPVFLSILLVLSLSAGVSAAPSSAFTYQGRLNSGGAMASGEYDFRFILYDAGIGGSQVGNIVSMEDWAVTDGLFTVQLDFGGGAFTGDARWLEIGVREGSSVDPLTILSPRQSITATPTALFALDVATHSHWGESWSGTGAGLTLSSTGGDDLRLGGSEGSIAAVSSGTSDLILRSNDGVDVYLDDDGGQSSEFRIRDSGGGEIFAVGEDGTLSWQERTGYLSIPAAAFRPRNEGYDFTNTGRELRNDDGASDYFRAPVLLPHGVTVTRLTFFYSDSSGEEGLAELRRNNMDDTHSQLAYVTTVNGQPSGVDDSISFATVDNSQYSYFMLCNLPDTDMEAYGMIIEYTYTEPH
jgi:hypothetical protein